MPQENMWIKRGTLSELETYDVAGASGLKFGWHPNITKGALKSIYSFPKQ